MIPKIQAQYESLKKEVLAGNLGAVLTRYGDLMLVVAVACMVGLMIVPLPTWLLDLLLTVNITAAVTVLMVSIYISNATQIASYPTLLLITTLYRLSLDISATRLILLQADAGEVIHSFGNFVVQGNFVVGAVIFLIITLVQFIVITKGAERVAEVAARFTLDAMPGKQMSIDADLRAGIIDFQQARARREGLAKESQFYGAMDGAMKFVKGDAIAGIVITLINIAGGLVIGILMNGMTAKDALETYSILTIGNGLVSQIPALLISISAGLVVTRVAAEASDTNLGKEIVGQFMAQPRAIAVAAGLLTILGLTPGLPKIPFFLMALTVGAIGYGLQRARKPTEAEARAEEKAKAAEIASKGPELAMPVPVALLVSPDLMPFVGKSSEAGQQFFDTIRTLQQSLYLDTGVIFPTIQVAENSNYPAGAYQLSLNEVPIANGQLKLDMLLVNSPARNLTVFGIKGEETKNPATGQPATWTSKDVRDRLKALGLAYWDTHEVLLLHITHFLRKNSKEFLGVQEVQWMVARLKESYPALVDEVTPKPVSYQLLTYILKTLAEERVSIRDLKSIFQALSECGRSVNEPADIIAHVRASLKNRICHQLSTGKPTLFYYSLDDEIEEIFRNSLRYTASGPQLEMENNMTLRIVAALRAQIGNLPSTAQAPVLMVTKDIRYFVKRLLSREFPDLSVICFDEVSARIRIQRLSNVALIPES